MKSLSTLRLLLAISICSFSLFSSRVLSQGVSPNAGIYWIEGFQANTLNASSKDPSVTQGTVVATWQQADAGVWAFYGAYQTSGSSCITGDKHIRMAKYTDGTIPWLVSPIVNAGISEVHFTVQTATKRWIVQWTADTSAVTSNWTTILDSVTVKTSCVDTALLVSLPNAQRIRFKDVSGVAAGYQLDVDSIYFKSYAALPVRFANVNANLLNNVVKVNWTSESELNVASYSIERSTGAGFKEIGNIGTSNSKNYSFLDKTPSAGVNYYRIKATDNNGSVLYSSIVKVLVETKSAGITVFPNPVVGQKLNIQIDGVDAGKYAINIYSISGQRVSTTAVTLSGGSLSQALALPNIKAGIYQLELTNGSTRITKTISVQ